MKPTIGIFGMCNGSISLDFQAQRLSDRLMGLRRVSPRQVTWKVIMTLYKVVPLRQLNRICLEQPVLGVLEDPGRSSTQMSRMTGISKPTARSTALGKLWTMVDGSWHSLQDH